MCQFFFSQAFPAMYRAFLVAYRNACAAVDRNAQTVDANANSQNRCGALGFRISRHEFMFILDYIWL